MRTVPDEDAPWVRGALGLDGPVAAMGRGRSTVRGPPLRCYFQTRKRIIEEGFQTWRSEAVLNFLRDDEQGSGRGRLMPHQGSGQGAGHEATP